jgi:hypothetical protein
MMQISAFVIWFFAVAGISRVIKHYAPRPLSTWALGRRLYFICWILIVVTEITMGFDLFIGDLSHIYWFKVESALLYVLLAIVPCGLKDFNTDRRLALLRRAAFIGFAFGFLILSVLQ